MENLLSNSQFLCFPHTNKSIVICSLLSAWSHYNIRLCNIVAMGGNLNEFVHNYKLGKGWGRKLFSDRSVDAWFRVLSWRGERSGKLVKARCLLWLHTVTVVLSASHKVKCSHSLWIRMTNFIKILFDSLRTNLFIAYERYTATISLGGRSLLVEWSWG